MKNPIIDNRIVSNKTFALRLLSFATESGFGDACSEDERESMISYSSKLLEYQIETATDEYELAYLKRCNASKKLKEAKKFLR
jgi:hypothetical protein